MIPPHVTALPSVLVQSTGVDTVAFQMAYSLPAGATPLLQLLPNSRLLLLFALNWSACTDRTARQIPQLIKSCRGKKKAVAGKFFIVAAIDLSGSFQLIQVHQLLWR